MCYNIVVRHEISWPRGKRLWDTQDAFHRQVCGMRALSGMIDVTHVSMAQPPNGTREYYYFKKGGYSTMSQAVVDSNIKRFLDLYIGIPSNVNDSRILRRSTLYLRNCAGTLFDDDASVHGFHPYLIGD